MLYRADIHTIQTKYSGKVVGTGQCVAFVEEAAATPRTNAWKRGALARGNPAIATGTAIATFDPDGAYGNHTDERSHAAIYISQNAQGLVVYDQWLGQPVHQRTIFFRDATYQGHAVNDGNRFYVID